MPILEPSPTPRRIRDLAKAMSNKARLDAFVAAGLEAASEIERLEAELRCAYAMPLAIEAAEKKRAGH
jgi:hypothetical protein